jgi:hypothetical protein
MERDEKKALEAGSICYRFVSRNLSTDKAFLCMMLEICNKRKGGNSTIQRYILY